MRKALLFPVVVIVVVTVLCIGLSSAGGVIQWPGSGSSPVVAALCYFPAAMLASVWTFTDANSRRKPGWLWALVSFFGVFPIGFLVYVLLGRS
jgi:hypothetical protein